MTVIQRKDKLKRYNLSRKKIMKNHNNNRIKDKDKNKISYANKLDCIEISTSFHRTRD